MSMLMLVSDVVLGRYEVVDLTRCRQPSRRTSRGADTPGWNPSPR
jgi:hypothetical protein